VEFLKCLSLIKVRINVVFNSLMTCIKTSNAISFLNIPNRGSDLHLNLIHSVSLNSTSLHLVFTSEHLNLYKILIQGSHSYFI